jgi:hypothetical protein
MGTENYYVYVTDIKVFLHVYKSGGSESCYRIGVSDAARLH